MIMQKMTVYGLPLTPRKLIEQLAGASFCVSYATCRGAQVEDAIRFVGKDQILLVDNGAYTHWKRCRKAGGSGEMTEAYIDGFEEWAQDILDRCPQAVAVLPDIIGGTPDENYRLMCETMLDTDRCMAIWHLDEPIPYLIDLCERFGWIGFGSAGAYKTPGKPEWHARIKEALAAIDAWDARQKADNEGLVRPRLHLMRAQAFFHLYPFDSCDSCNIALNHCYYKHEGEGHVARMAKRIDGKVQGSAGPAAEHQIKRPLLEHVEQTRWEIEHRIEVATMRAAELGLIPRSVVYDRYPAAKAVAEMIDLAVEKWKEAA